MPKLSHRELSYELDAHGVGYDDVPTEAEADRDGSEPLHDSEALFRASDLEHPLRRDLMQRYEDLLHVGSLQAAATSEEQAADQQAHESDTNPDDIGLLEVAVASLERAGAARDEFLTEVDRQCRERRGEYFSGNPSRLFTYYDQVWWMPEEQARLAKRTASEHEALQEIAPELKRNTIIAIEELIERGIVPEHVRDRLDRIEQADVHTVGPAETHALGYYDSGIIHINPGQYGRIDLEDLKRVFIHESFHMLEGRRGKWSTEGTIQREKRRAGKQRNGLKYRVDGEQYNWLNEAITEYLASMATDAVKGRDPKTTPLLEPGFNPKAIYENQRRILQLLAEKTQIGLGEFIEAYFEDSYTGPNNPEQGAYGELFSRIEAKLGPTFLREISKRSKNGMDYVEASTCVDEHIALVVRASWFQGHSLDKHK